MLTLLDRYQDALMRMVDETPAADYDGSMAIALAYDKYEALERVGALTLARDQPQELSHADEIRVALARALVTRPRVLLVRDPIDGVTSSTARSELLRLLRSFCDVEGLGVLFTVDQLAGPGHARSLMLSDGRIGGNTTPRSAPVVALHPRQSESA